MGPTDPTPEPLFPEGVDAAADTSLWAYGGGACRPVPFIADRPFLFLVLHRASGTILFLGRVADPTKD